LAAYLGGSAPIGLIVGRAVLKVDIRQYGSGNIGATNVLRVLGAWWAALVFALDAAKGLIPVLVGRHLGVDATALAVVALLAVAGHNWSIFLRFRGGKGVATSLGALLALSPPTTAGVVLVWVLVVLISGYASLGSMLGLASSGLFLYLTGAPPQFVALGVVLAAVAAWQHRANIKRLLEGKELKFNHKVAPKGSTP
jgi:glycerol-3-phosphate acyltransferase PlsY